MTKKSSPKILVFDIETAPIEAYVWGLWDNNVALNQIKRDWFVFCWAAKWYGSPATEVIYHSQEKSKNITNDKKILEKLWKLLDEADIVMTKNGIRFDVKKINARFILHGMKPPSEYRHIDLERIARKFGFTSTRLEYLSEKLNKKYKKLKHKKFPGFELWEQCNKRNPRAWSEMKKYNIHDVLATEELYTTFLPWDTTLTFNVYTGKDTVCNCGNTKLKKNGYTLLSTGKYPRYQCTSCGSNYRDRRAEKGSSSITTIKKV